MLIGGSVVANELDCDIVATGFKLHSRYYVPFQTHNPGKSLNSTISPGIV